MRLAVGYGTERLELELADARRIATRPAPPTLADPAAAVRAALEAPHDFPPLRRALTPEDHVTVLVDERLPHVGRLLTPLLEHLTAAGVQPAAVTLLCPPPSRQDWVDELPEEFEEARLEVHDPADRQRLSYLATTANGKRLYLNRTAVEAELVVALTGRRYDPVLGYGGGEGAIYPALADEETARALAGRTRDDVPGAEPWPPRRAAMEAAWLLGQPFFVQLIPGPGDAIAHVVAGAAEACREGERLLDACWRQAVPRAADTVLATLTGDPARHTFADLADAAACAARVVVPGGRIVLLTAAAPDLPGADLLRAHDDPRAALKALQRHAAPGAAARWARAAAHARLYLLSGLPDEGVEELFATPLRAAGEVQRLLDAGGDCLLLEDAHKTMAEVG